ncbi:hypothetical protein M0812_22250 [Anaeramoeba flamelloides]|uniref:E2F/DP family winged-helix DNA-binding domain-containing protein n=1 Tax=Anaeramoeba flamelloides TaxID=1746091 RepID=A0AAV7YWR4_9EUKA|nr:hypothetical protein M0812_22250 [Anaeramoeba flamelloides]
MSFLFYPLLWQYGEYLYTTIEFETVFKLIRIRKKFAKKKLNIKQQTEENKKLIYESLAKVELLFIQNRVIVCPEKKRRRRRKTNPTPINLNFDQSKEKYLLSPIWSSVFLKDPNQKTMTRPKDNKVEQINIVKENLNKQKEQEQNSKKGTKRSTKLKKTPRSTRTIGLLGLKILQCLREGPKSRECLSNLTGFSKQRVCTILGIYKLLHLVTENEEKGLFYWNAEQGNFLPKAAPYCQDIYKARKVRQQLALKLQELTGKLISRSRQERMETEETIEKSKIFSNTINCLTTTTPVELQNIYYNKQEPKSQEQQNTKEQNTCCNKQEQEQAQQNIKDEFSKDDIQEIVEKLKKHKKNLSEKRNNLTKTLFCKNRDQNRVGEHQITLRINEKKISQKTLQKEKPVHIIQITKSKRELFQTRAKEKQSSLIKEFSEKTEMIPMEKLPIIETSEILPRSNNNPSFPELKLPIVPESSCKENNNPYTLKIPLFSNSINNSPKNLNSENNNDGINNSELIMNSLRKKSGTNYQNMETKNDLETSKQTNFSLSETVFLCPKNSSRNLFLQPENSISPQNNDTTITRDYNDLNHLRMPIFPPLNVLSNDQTQNYLEIPQFFPNNFVQTLPFGENSRFNFEHNWNLKNNFDLTLFEYDISFI